MTPKQLNVLMWAFGEDAEMGLPDLTRKPIVELARSHGLKKAVSVAKKWKEAAK